MTGSLNAHKVYILAKNRLMADRSDSRSSNAKSSSSASQFEQSFRVQVSKRVPTNIRCRDSQMSPCLIFIKARKRKKENEIEYF